MEAEDISEYLSKLFIEVELLTFDIKAFYTAKKNQALIVNNFVYHLKTVGKSSHRWVCKSCLASITTGSGPTEEDIIKINGKKTELDKPLTAYHKHSPLSDEEVSKILIHERIKNRAESQNVPIQKLFEEEEIRMAKEGKSAKEIADGMYQYESKKSSLYR